MTIKKISELEFIGESLPKINGNFSELDTRAITLENTSTQYSGLSSFYSTHSNNSNINFKSESQPTNFGGVIYQKSQVYGSGYADIPDLNSIIYPAILYFNILNSSENTTVTYTVKIQETSSSPLKTFISNWLVPRAKTTNQTDYSSESVTFMDIGYFDWSVQIVGSSSQTNLAYSIKYLN
jgi:hypothetical protein